VFEGSLLRANTYRSGPQHRACVASTRADSITTWAMAARRDCWGACAVSMTMDPVVEPSDIQIAPGSVVVVRDEEWLVRETEQTADGLLVHVQGLGELVRDTRACFYQSLDDIRSLDPAAAKVVADESPRYRKSRVWLESMFRRTPLPLADPSLTVSTRALADPLTYQQTAVRKVLDPTNIRPRVLLADAVGLGKTHRDDPVRADPPRAEGTHPDRVTSACAGADAAGDVGPFRTAVRPVGLGGHPTG
jgi:hypothetical protein